MHFHFYIFNSFSRIKDQESEIAQLRAENELIRKQALPYRSGPMNVPIPQVPSKLGLLVRGNSATFDPQNEIQASGSAANATAPMVSSVAKVVQPTATVSSIPVSGPSK